jgi:GNAT superfamily N-acetyltransferase
MPEESNQPTAELRVRDAASKEAEAIGALIRTAYAQFEATYPADWARYYQMIGELERHFENAQIIVVEDNGALAGAVIFYPDGSLSGQGEWPEGWAGVLRLAVHPEYRGRGIAKALMDECINRARGAGISTLALHTTEWMGVSAMYERMCFVRDESFDFIPRPGIYAFGYKLELHTPS